MRLQVGVGPAQSRLNLKDTVHAAAADLGLQIEPGEPTMVLAKRCRAALGAADPPLYVHAPVGQVRRPAPPAPPASARRLALHPPFLQRSPPHALTPHPC